MWRFLLNKQKLCLPSVLLTAFSLALLLNVNNPLLHLLQRVSSSDISISWLGCGLRADYRWDGYYSVLTGIGTLFFVFLLIRPQKGLSSVADRWMRNCGLFSGPSFLQGQWTDPYLNSRFVFSPDIWSLSGWLHVVSCLIQVSHIHSCIQSFAQLFVLHLALHLKTAPFFVYYRLLFHWKNNAGFESYRIWPRYLLSWHWVTLTLYYLNTINIWVKNSNIDRPAHLLAFLYTRHVPPLWAERSVLFQRFGLTLSCSRP